MEETQREGRKEKGKGRKRKSKKTEIEGIWKREGERKGKENEGRRKGETGIGEREKYW